MLVKSARGDECPARILHGMNVQEQVARIDLLSSRCQVPAVGQKEAGIGWSREA